MKLMNSSGKILLATLMIVLLYFVIDAKFKHMTL